MNTEIMEYAIVIEKTKAVLVTTNNFQYDRDRADQNLELFRGMTVQIKGRQNSYSVVVICDLHQDNLAFQNNLYYVKTTALQSVTETIWLLLVAIPDPHERSNVAKDKEYIEYLETVKISTLVKVNPQYFSMCPIRQSLQFLPERDMKEFKEQDYDCIVRYIGFVPELGSGFFYGLELLVIFSPLSL